MSKPALQTAVTVIDKVALIDIKDKKMLVTRSHDNDTWYLPGGKRHAGETDVETLQREIKEELGVTIQPESVRYFDTFEASAHGKPAGTIVRAICYTATYEGPLQPSHEVAEAAYFSYDQKGLTGQVAHYLFDRLVQQGLIA